MSNTCSYITTTTVMILDTFITSEIFLVPLCSQFHSTTPSSWQPLICFLACWFSYIWCMVSHIVFESIFFHLAYCIWESFVLLCVSVVLFYCWVVVVYCIAIPLFINSLVSRHLDCFLMALVHIIAMYKSFVNIDSHFFQHLTVFSQHFEAVILQSSGLPYCSYETCWSNCCYLIWFSSQPAFKMSSLYLVFCIITTLCLSKDLFFFYLVDIHWAFWIWRSSSKLLILFRYDPCLTIPWILEALNWIECWIISWFMTRTISMHGPLLHIFIIM